MSRQRAFDIAFVAIVTAIGAWLRLRQLGVPSFWLDEIIHYDATSNATTQSLWQWLAISQIENGPLFYATQLAGRLWLPMEASARIAPALCGIAAIPLMWLVARSAIGDRATAYAATLLLALSPLHVYYSREARPYALVVLIAAALLAVVLRGGSLRAILLFLLAAFYSTALIAPFIFSIAVAAILTRQQRVAIASVVCLVLMALCYHPGSVPIGQKQFPRFATLLDSFAVTGIDVMRTHRTAYVFALLAIVGAIVLARRNSKQAIVVITLAILPVLIPVIAAWRMRPYFSVRYTLPALPAYLLLAAIGITAILSFIGDARVQIAACIVATALLCKQGWKGALNEPFRKLDWRIIARAIARHAQPGDRIIAAHHWSAYCLGFYLRDIAPRLPIFDAKGFPQPEPMSPTWIVVAQDPKGTFTPWACRFPTLLGSPIENFHLHFAGAARQFPRLDEDSGAYLDEISVWRARDGRDLPPGFDRAKLTGLLQRLGFNPDRAVPALTSRRVTLANLTSTIADDSFCDDDATFLRRLYAALFNRDITASEQRDQKAKLSGGLTRSMLAWRLGDSDEARNSVR